MFSKLIEFMKQPLGQIVLVIAALAFVGGAGFVIYQTQVPPPQPLDFQHGRHIGLGVPCLYCHPGAWRGQTAGLPTQEKCWGCHQQMAITQTSEKLKPLVAAMNGGDPLVWVPVAIMPDFVYFAHSPHIASGLNCENCHGDVSKMTVATPQQPWNMGWCLDCHKNRAPEKAAKLTDCVTCHK